MSPLVLRGETNSDDLELVPDRRRHTRISSVTERRGSSLIECFSIGVVPKHHQTRHGNRRRAKYHLAFDILKEKGADRLDFFLSVTLGLLGVGLPLLSRCTNRRDCVDALASGRRGGRLARRSAHGARGLGTGLPSSGSKGSVTTTRTECVVEMECLQLGNDLL